jgi:hypothetical protein
MGVNRPEFYADFGPKGILQKVHQKKIIPKIYFSKSPQEKSV